VPSANDTANLNYSWSQALIGGLVAAGVTRAVISPGSRSTPLALAMLRQPGLDCEVIVDERCAAFFALGAARASRTPVAVLATSGTAVANWLPAVIEAAQAGVPLLLISADRPPELQGVGANQTIHQPGLFGPHVRASHDLGAPEAGFDAARLTALAARTVDQASWPYPGPVHINQPFREPLVPDLVLPAAPAASIRTQQPPLQPSPQSLAELAGLLSKNPGLIVCGELPEEESFAVAVTELAERLACPILAEPLSNLRFGRHRRNHLLVRYNRWPGAAAGGEQAGWLLRFGAFPVTRKLQQLVAEHVGPHIVVDPWPRWNDPLARLSHLLRATPTEVCRSLLGQTLNPAPAAWLAAWQRREDAAAREASDNQAALITRFLAALPDHCPVFVGNSLAIRSLDSYSGCGERPLHFFANRGASGIDGNISSALGIAAIHGRAVALLGDLTAQHDIGGLANARGRDAVIVVVNNGGGGIFEHLPQAGLPEFERGWLTPQHIDFRSAAATFGLTYGHATTDDSLTLALQAAIAAGGPHLIEVTL
jgi:2-succinyl-5-enolpyruvyl-6-hydroxy-3-cyclohexene-1-carboxylate synthase